MRKPDPKSKLWIKVDIQWKLIRKTNTSKKTIFCSVRMHVYQTSNSNKWLRKLLQGFFTSGKFSVQTLWPKHNKVWAFLAASSNHCKQEQHLQNIPKHKPPFQKKQDGNHEPECSHVILRWTDHNHITVHLSTFFVCAAMTNTSPQHLSLTLVKDTSLQHLVATLLYNTSVQLSSPMLFSNSYLQRFSTTLLPKYFSTTLHQNTSQQHWTTTFCYNTLLQHFSTKMFSNTSLRHFHNTSQQHFFTTLPYNTSPQHFTTTLLYNTSLHDSTTTFLHNASLQHFTTTLLQNTSLQLPQHSPTNFHNTSLQQLLHNTSPQHFSATLHHKTPSHLVQTDSPRSFQFTFMDSLFFAVLDVAKHDLNQEHMHPATSGLLHPTDEALPSGLVTGHVRSFQNVLIVFFEPALGNAHLQFNLWPFKATVLKYLMLVLSCAAGAGCHALFAVCFLSAKKVAGHPFSQQPTCNRTCQTNKTPAKRGHCRR